MISLPNALDEHIRYRARTCTNEGYLRNVRASVGKFITSATGATHVEDVLGYHVNRFEVAHEGNPQTLSHVRRFLDWCRTRYSGAVPQLSRKAIARRRHPQVLRGAAERKIAVWQDNAAKAAECMRLPHQRAIFLLGYLYGLQLSDLLTFGASDLSAMADATRDDFYHELSAINGLGPNNALFAPWLAGTRTTATKRWREWVGETKVPFDDVVRAGQVDRVFAGMAPKCERVVAHTIVNALPGVSKAGLGRMKRWWD